MAGANTGMRALRRFWHAWCWSCIATGWGLFLMSHGVHAATQSANGPDWQAVAYAFAGVCAVVVAVWAKRVESDIKANEQDAEKLSASLTSLREEVRIGFIKAHGQHNIIRSQLARIAARQYPDATDGDPT